jgi:hypothetical protein
VRRQTSYHEIGHVLAARLLNVPVDHVSIRPGDHFGGIAHFGAVPKPTDIGGYAVPMVAQPREFRDYCERDMLTSLAGPIGGLMAGPLGRSDLTDADDDFALRAAAALERVSPRTRELVLTAEKAPEESFHNDEDEAMRMAVLLNSNHPEATPTTINYFHVNMMREEAKQLLEKHSEQLLALAAELLKRTILTGPEIDDILRTAPPCRCHTWPEVKP